MTFGFSPMGGASDQDESGKEDKSDLVLLSRKSVNQVNARSSYQIKAGPTAMRAKPLNEQRATAGQLLPVQNQNNLGSLHNSMELGNSHRGGKNQLSMLSQPPRNVMTKRMLGTSIDVNKQSGGDA